MQIRKWINYEVLNSCNHDQIMTLKEIRWKQRFVVDKIHRIYFPAITQPVEYLEKEL